MVHHLSDAFSELAFGSISGLIVTAGLFVAEFTEVCEQCDGLDGSVYGVVDFGVE